MPHAILAPVLRRAEQAQSESDYEYFFNLLLAGEALAKLLTTGLLAAVGDGSERHRYRLEHDLARADGLGDWSRILEDALSGPAAQYLLHEARPERNEFTSQCSSGAWQYEAVAALTEAADSLKLPREEFGSKTDLKRWFRVFATMRNKTRGHGATTAGQAGPAAISLNRSITLIYENASLLQRPWAALRRNLSGKYRVTRLAGDESAFAYLRSENTHSFADGVYVHIGALRRVPLLECDSDCLHFFFANGSFKPKSFEMLCYASAETQDGDSTQYLLPPGTLPESETAGHGLLEAVGQCFSNAPVPTEDYVSRPALEAELLALLLEQRRPIVTLLGSGGVGKTSLSLKVLQDVYNTDRFTAVVWLSARDIDLQLRGPKSVRPTVRTQEDMSALYASLVLHDEKRQEKNFNARTFFEAELTKSSIGPCLFVFDNFETTSSPIEVYNWIDTYIREPNKVLITTRLRDFRGDYPIEINGMSRGESMALIESTTRRLSIADFVTSGYAEQLIDLSEGHPYIIKMLLGQVAHERKASNIRSLVAGSNEVLTALFERTYASLTPCAQRAFLTLAAWNASVPRVALEAVLIRSLNERREVERGIEMLMQYSLAELESATGGDSLIRLPLVSAAFGQRKLNVSPHRAQISADSELLQLLGPSRPEDLRLGVARRFDAFVKNVAKKLDKGEHVEQYEAILEMICRSYPAGWLTLARLHMESPAAGADDKARHAVERYLEASPTGESAGEAWKLLTALYSRRGDRRGEVTSQIEWACLASSSFRDLSTAANRLNSALRDRVFEGEERQILANRVLTQMVNRSSEADSVDLSRMAWLAVYADRNAEARSFAERGVALDPTDVYCNRLLEKLRTS
jgi:hypothetical protein